MKNTPIYAIAIASVLATAAHAQQTMPAPAAVPGHAPAHAAAFVKAQAPDQWLASQLVGMTVYGPGDETLGDVNDVLFDRKGNVVAAVIGVGGFLGVGEKAVAVPIQAVTVTRHDKADRLVLNKTKDELKAAPGFEKYQPAPESTGSVARPPMPATPAR